MKIFIDLDNTLFNTKSVLNGKLTGDLLLAEWNAPLFQGAKETLEKFHKNGHECFAVTSRGYVSDEEIKITKAILLNLGIISRDPSSLLVGMVDHISDKFKEGDGKYEAIKGIFNHHYKSDVQSGDTILIDDDFNQVAYAATQGVKGIWFTSDDVYNNLSLDEKNYIAKLNVLTATSWNEIADIVLNKESKSEAEC